MGESVTEGTILEWRKAVGDAVEADETLVEVSTDKVDAEVPSPAAGTIAKILVAEGDTVEVGQVLAQISVNGEAPATAEGGDTSVEGDPVPGTEQAAEAATSEAATRSTPRATVRPPQHRRPTARSLTSSRRRPASP